MSSWASRRKAIYFWSVVLALTAVSFLIFWRFWYKTPTCSDRLQNGDETGIDCGGSCSLVCSMQALSPIQRSDPRVFKVMDNIYSVLAFVENHNVDLEASFVPYKFKIYDDKNKLLYERPGATIFPKNRKTAIFEGNLLIANAEPKRAEILLPPNISWTRNTKDEPKINIQNSPLLKESSSPRIKASISNKSIEDLKNIELVAVVYDSRDNAIAASRTFINELKKNNNTDIFFTWPKPFDLGVKACSQPSDVIVAIDRSGSMASISKNPPEPLESVKTAAETFVSELKEGDRAGLVSFATLASSPSEIKLMSNFVELVSAINKITIKENGIQYTNIADAIEKSFEILIANTNEQTKKIIVLLTDGVATKPTNPLGSETKEEEIGYAEDVANQTANLAKQNGAVIYTIGLGNDIHHEFLQRIASTPDNYFFAPSTTTLKGIYEKISRAICKELPARIEITYKILKVRN